MDYIFQLCSRAFCHPNDYDEKLNVILYNRKRRVSYTPLFTTSFLFSPFTLGYFIHFGKPPLW